MILHVVSIKSQSHRNKYDGCYKSHPLNKAEGLILKQRLILPVAFFEKHILRDKAQGG